MAAAAAAAAGAGWLFCSIDSVFYDKYIKNVQSKSEYGLFAKFLIYRVRLG